MLPVHWMEVTAALVRPAAGACSKQCISCGLYHPMTLSPPAGPPRHPEPGVQQGGGGEAEENDGGKPPDPEVRPLRDIILDHLIYIPLPRSNNYTIPRSLRLTQLSASQEELRR